MSDEAQLPPDFDAKVDAAEMIDERMTRLCPATVLVVEGDAENRAVTSIRTIWKGAIQESEPGNLEKLRQYIRKWSNYAMANSALRQKQEGQCQ